MAKINLTENKLHNIIVESVHYVLNEDLSANHSIGEIYSMIIGYSKELNRFFYTNTYRRLLNSKVRVDNGRINNPRINSDMEKWSTVARNIRQIYYNEYTDLVQIIQEMAPENYWKKLESDKQQWAEAHPKSGMVGFNNKPNISFNFGSLREVQEIQNRVAYLINKTIIPYFKRNEQIITIFKMIAKGFSKIAELIRELLFILNDSTYVFHMKDDRDGKYPYSFDSAKDYLDMGKKPFA